MLEKKGFEWIKAIVLYFFLAMLSIFFSGDGHYVFIWLPAGYSIYRVIRGEGYTLGIIFVAAALSYGSFILFHNSQIPSALTMFVGMAIFGMIEALCALLGKVLFGYFNKRLDLTQHLKLGYLILYVVLLPSICFGFLCNFIDFNIRVVHYRVILSEWFGASVAYFLGCGLILPFFFYYHQEKGNTLVIIRQEMRWTALVLFILTLVVGIFVWPKAFVGAIFIGIILLPYFNGTLGSALVIFLSLAIANNIVRVSTLSIESIWMLYGSLFIDVLAILWGFHLVIHLLKDHHQRVEALEHIIDEQTKKIDICMERIDEFADYDQLTGTLNKRSFIERGNLEVMRMKRYKRDLTLMHIDIDGLKNINDQHGYQVGDHVIVAISSICKENLRNSDIIARIAGDEFAILMPETKDNDGMLVAEKIREAILDFKADGKNHAPVSITVSIGVTNCFEKIDQCLVSADTALYRAKKAGKNRVVLSSK